MTRRSTASDGLRSSSARKLLRISCPLTKAAPGSQGSIPHLGEGFEGGLVGIGEGVSGGVRY